jgi:LL-diaminopimelate aminotransferase
VHELPLKKENCFLPDLGAVPKDVLKKARLMFLNYPNNPTSATATVEFFNEAAALAKKHNIILAHDAAYLEISYNGYKAPSIFEADGARDVAIEFHSLSKTFNMTGWRLGFAVGKAELVAPLAKMKTNYDSSAAAFVQMAGASALAEYEESVAHMCGIYQRRRAIFSEGLSRLGWKVHSSNAAFYVWVELPKGTASARFAADLMERTGVVATPGVGFGRHGEGYIRFSLTAPDERIEMAVKRLA